MVRAGNGRKRNVNPCCPCLGGRSAAVGLPVSLLRGMVRSPAAAGVIERFRTIQIALRRRSGCQWTKVGRRGVQRRELMRWVAGAASCMAGPAVWPRADEVIE